MIDEKKISAVLHRHSEGFVGIETLAVKSSVLKDLIELFETEIALQTAALWKVAKAADILTRQMGTKEHPVPHYWDDAFCAVEISLAALDVASAPRTTDDGKEAR